MDEKLIEAVRLMAEGNEEGFNKVYAATYNHVYFRAKSYLNNEDDAFDLIQNVYIEAFENISKLKNPIALFGWLDAITYRQCMKFFRKNKEVLLTEDSEDIFDLIECEDVNAMPELSAEEREKSKILRDLIEELPELQKAVIIAHYYDGLTIKAIAEMLGCSEGTVKSRLSYARKALKKKVEAKERREGFTLHGITFSVLWYAIKMLSDKTRINDNIVQSIYEKICKALGFAASATFTAATAIAAEVANQSFAAEGAPSFIAEIIGKLSAFRMGIGAFIVAVSVAIAGVTGGIVNIVTNRKDNTVQLEDGIEEIRSAAFKDCIDLESIKLPDSLKHLGDFAFFGCSSLKEITIPKGVTYMGVSVFSYCKELKNVVIEEGVAKIADSMFAYCSELEKVVIPASVEEIGLSVFLGCNKVTIYGESGSVAEQYALDNEIPFVALTE